MSGKLAKVAQTCQHPGLELPQPSTSKAKRNLIDEAIKHEVIYQLKCGGIGHIRLNHFSLVCKKVYA